MGRKWGRGSPSPTHPHCAGCCDCFLKARRSLGDGASVGVTLGDLSLSPSHPHPHSHPYPHSHPTLIPVPVPIPISTLILIFIPFPSPSLSPFPSHPYPYPHPNPIPSHLCLHPALKFPFLSCNGVGKSMQKGVQLGAGFLGSKGTSRQPGPGKDREKHAVLSLRMDFKQGNG